jgi:hypothetical protein
MTVFSKQNYEDQDEGRIIKAARKQKYIMIPALISFLKDELKAESRTRNEVEERGRRSRRCKVLLIEGPH